MVLGRTASNAVKIKTSPTRAVNCACCGGECECVNVSGIMIGSQLLSDILDSATTGTANGESPLFWQAHPNPNVDGWYAQWYPMGGGFFCAAFYDRITKSLCVHSDNAINFVGIGPKENCDYCTNSQYPVTCSDTTQSVNGYSFKATYVEFSSQFPFSAPSLVFS